MKIARDTNQSMQRVRVGMIGLAIVVLLIALASAVMRSATREVPVAAAGTVPPTVYRMAPGNPVVLV